jgi:hypothetical protein
MMLDPKSSFQSSQQKDKDSAVASHIFPNNYLHSYSFVLSLCALKQKIGFSIQ